MYRKILKPVIARVIALILFLLLSPLFLVTSILVGITSPGGVIFKQERLGKNGKLFKIFKFRSMVKDAINFGTGAHTFEGDPRITPIGRILRKTSIDELPQLINILKGDMCFIGPRPLLNGNPYYYEDYPTEYKKRYSVHPGMFCSVDVVYRAEATTDEQFELDVDYVENISLKNDIKIFFGTFLSVIQQKGIYECVDKDEEDHKIVEEANK